MSQVEIKPPFTVEDVQAFVDGERLLYVGYDWHHCQLLSHQLCNMFPDRMCVWHSLKGATAAFLTLDVDGHAGRVDFVTQYRFTQLADRGDWYVSPTHKDHGTTTGLMVQPRGVEPYFKTIILD